MVRFVRLAASVVMLTSGVWLITAFVGRPQESSTPAIAPQDNVREDAQAAAALSRMPRLIPDASGVADAEAAEKAQQEQAARATDLTPLAPLVAAPSAAAVPLPAVPTEICEHAPPLEAAYRSALDLPPPPLLDAHAPPPLAGGSTWRQSQPRASLASHQGQSQMATPGSDLATTAGLPISSSSQVVASYVVQDGDDLTSIATRFYGHPAAARMVFEANRDRLPSADVLPIGLTLQLPPPQGMGGQVTRPGGWIEPGAAPGSG
ncbi:MAG: hypothetical protein ISQ07_00175 [Pirellulales bacterium]|jgi:nucleoid-associated protein YgaU|nr:hypothetical protein [Pirellulales bacterium]